MDLVRVSPTSIKGRASVKSQPGTTWAVIARSKLIRSLSILEEQVTGNQIALSRWSKAI